MTTIVIAPSNVVTFPEGGGHFWVYMQYVQGLLRLGAEVYWLEEFRTTGDIERDNAMLSTFHERMVRYGLGGKTILYVQELPRETQGNGRRRFIGIPEAQAESAIRQADLLLNFCYGMASDLLGRFRRTALVDIDPGLLQFWMAEGQLQVAPHDIYFTTGETVGTPAALFPDCGLSWERIQPPVSLESWPYHFDPKSEAFTTVSGWWGGGGKGEFIADGKGLIYENNKRVTFLQFVDLPRLTKQPLELALSLGGGDPEAETESTKEATRAEGHAKVTDYVSDAVDRATLEQHGWRVRHAYEIRTPEEYRTYIQGSRGEFSCVKPSCIKFQNAWVSDRTLCYLASGKPVVVQDTGPSRVLPSGAGMFRFSNPAEAVNAIEAINLDYELHCKEARQIAESSFDAERILTRVLEIAL